MDGLVFGGQVILKLGNPIGLINHNEQPLD
jgi:hypothetical protein